MNKKIKKIPYPVKKNIFGYSIEEKFVWGDIDVIEKINEMIDKINEIEKEIKKL